MNQGTQRGLDRNQGSFTQRRKVDLGRTRIETQRLSVSDILARKPKSEI